MLKNPLLGVPFFCFAEAFAALPCVPCVQGRFKPLSSDQRLHCVIVILMQKWSSPTHLEMFACEHSSRAQQIPFQHFARVHLFLCFNIECEIYFNCLYEALFSSIVTSFILIKTLFTFDVANPLQFIQFYFEAVAYRQSPQKKGNFPHEEKTTFT